MGEYSHLLDSASLRDVTVLFVLPSLVLIGIFVHPNSERLLEYQLSQPTLLTVIGSNLAHRGLTHLVRNLAAFWALGVLTYALAADSGLQREFQTLLLLLILVLPVLASPLMFWLVSLVPTSSAETFAIAGFSLTISGLLAVYTTFIGEFSRTRLADAIDPFTVSGLLFLSGLLSGVGRIYAPYFDRLPAGWLFLGASVVAAVLVVYLGVNLRLTSVVGTQLIAAALLIGVFYVSAFRFLRLSIPEGGEHIHMAGYIGGYYLFVITRAVTDSTEDDGHSCRDQPRPL